MASAKMGVRSDRYKKERELEMNATHQVINRFRVATISAAALLLAMAGRPDVAGGKIRVS